MGGNKRYYWLKLKEDFFEDDTIEWLEEQENGERYVLFYLKLCLKSLKEDGCLIRYVGETLIPYDVKALAKLTNTDQDTVAVALKTFTDIGLIELKDSGEIYMKQIDEMIGSETDVAKRVRKHRARQNLIKNNIDLLHCNDGVTKCNTEYRDKSIEIDTRDRDKELDIELEDDSATSVAASPQQPVPYNEILLEFNRICTTLPNIRSIEGNRQRTVRAWYRTLPNGMDDVTKFFELVHSSDFLSGRNGKWLNCSFDWIIKPSNRQKILEGNYHKDNKNSGNSGGDSFSEFLRKELEKYEDE